jgi:hypothetical protein
VSFENFIWLYLWIAPHLLLILVAILMYRRSQHKAFPIFFTYLLFEFLKTCLLFAMHSLKTPGPIYLKTDLLCRSASIALHFGILQELFSAPVASNASMRRGVARMLNWITVVMIGLAAVFIGAVYYSSMDQGIAPIYAVIEALNMSQCGLIVLVFLWHGFLGLRMRPLAFGIALGMGLATGLDPFIVALKSSVAPASYRMVDILQMAVYHVAVLFWVYYAQVREKVRSDSTAVLPQWAEQAAKLGRIVNP